MRKRNRKHGNSARKMRRAADKLLTKAERKEVRGHFRVEMFPNGMTFESVRIADADVPAMLDIITRLQGDLVKRNDALSKAAVPMRAAYQPPAGLLAASGRLVEKTG